jgi:hypothetical protein
MAYNQFGVTIIRMVEKAGINKAFTAIPYIQENTIRDVLQLCIETPYYGLRGALQRAYPQSRDRHRRSRSKEELRRAAERSAVQVILDNTSCRGRSAPPLRAVPYGRGRLELREYRRAVRC